MQLFKIHTIKRMRKNLLTGKKAKKRRNGDKNYFVISFENLRLRKWTDSEEEINARIVVNLRKWRS